MIAGVFALAAVFGVVVLALLLIFRKDLVGVDLTARSLLRLYLYLASLAGVIVFVVGAAALLDWAAGSLFGTAAIYGRVPMVYDPNVYPPNLESQSALRHQDDLLRGLTLLVFGALFYGGHRFARRALADAEEAGSVLRRAYNTIGMFVFGVGTLVLLPVGIYQALSYTLITPPADVFQSGFGDSLMGGIVSVPVWLVYLFRIVRAAPKVSVTRTPVRPAAIPTGVA